MRHYLFLLLPFFLFATHYDCIVIGSSPISLCEALYQDALGNRVLILEGTATLGGAWQVIDRCGVTSTDLGCHTFCNNSQMADFLRKYIGCSIAPIDKVPHSGKSSLYFSHGCRELMSHLQTMLQNSSIEIRLNHEVTAAVVDEGFAQVTVQAGGTFFSAQKVFLTPFTYFPDEKKKLEKRKFYHLYLLIHDPTPPKFIYEWGIPQTTRVMNATNFVEFAQKENRQFIIFQTHQLEAIEQAEKFLSELKKKNLLDPAAYLIQAETSIYEQWPPHQLFLHKDYPSLFELLETSHFSKMVNYIDRWKTAIKPYQNFTP